MFYHPHFCCHCGEKIVRSKWTPLTSRRFCEFCAIEQKQHDLVPRAAAVLLLLFGAAGFTAYLSSSKDSTAQEAVKIGGLRRKSAALEKEFNVANKVPADPAQVPESRSGIGQSNVSQTENKQRSAPQNSSTEPIYYCGAMTKKGTACTRRVKAPGRCWQHLGQPAVTPSRN